MLMLYTTTKFSGIALLSFIIISQKFQDGLSSFEPNELSITLSTLWGSGVTVSRLGADIVH